MRTLILVVTIAALGGCAAPVNRQAKVVPPQSIVVEGKPTLSQRLKGHFSKKTPVLDIEEVPAR